MKKIVKIPQSSQSLLFCPGHQTKHSSQAGSFFGKVVCSKHHLLRSIKLNGFGFFTGSENAAEKWLLAP